MPLKKRIHTIVILAFLLFSMKQVVAQTQETVFNKNAIYGSIGYLGLYGSATVYYERMIKQKMWHRNISSFVKVAYGAEVHYGGESTYLLTQYGILTGVKKHHLEVSFGPGYFINGDFSRDYIPTGAIGWRIQKPGGSFIFRMGVGIPESIYIGLGISF